VRVSPRRQPEKVRVETDTEQSGPSPQPERREPRLRDPGLFELSWADYRAVAKRTVKETLADNMTLIAGALAYSTFLAIPSALLVALGLFSLFASPSAITALTDRLNDVAPQQAVSLLDDSLRRLTERPSTGITITIIGFALALWSTTGAMNAFMTGVNIAYDREDTRGFVRKRLVALEMVACMVIAFLLVFGLLVLGPQLSRWIGDALEIQGVIGWLWWIAQWPLLVLGLLLVFGALLYLAPNVEHPRWRFITAGSVFAVLAWLATSAGFAVYTSQFGSYNKTWGSLGAVVVMLTWLWVSSLALLVGAELNAELERSRELRRGEAAEERVQAPPKEGRRAA
jgi:membrane protein